MWAFAHGLATRVKQETGRCRLPGLSCLKTQRRDFHDYDGDHRAVFEDTSATHLTRREENSVEWAMDSFHFIYRYWEDESVFSKADQGP